jgi:hypothetical protein
MTKTVTTKEKPNTFLELIGFMIREEYEFTVTSNVSSAAPVSLSLPIFDGLLTLRVDGTYEYKLN